MTARTARTPRAAEAPEPEWEIDVSVTVNWRRVRVQAPSFEAAQLRAVDKVRMLPDDLPSEAGPFVTAASPKRRKRH